MQRVKVKRVFAWKEVVCCRYKTGLKMDFSANQTYDNWNRLTRNYSEQLSADSESQTSLGGCIQSVSNVCYLVWQIMSTVIVTFHWTSPRYFLDCSFVSLWRDLSSVKTHYHVYFNWKPKSERKRISNLLPGLLSPTRPVLSRRGAI